MNISVEWKSTAAVRRSSHRHLVIISYGVHFLKEYGMIIQMQSVGFSIPTITGNMLPLIIHHWSHF
jgi:hypothetical protein